MHVCQFSHATFNDTRLGVVDGGEVTNVDTEATNLDAALVEHDWPSLERTRPGTPSRSTT
jgi:hypothetical protein